MAGDLGLSLSSGFTYHRDIGDWRGELPLLDELEEKCHARVGEILNMKWRLDSLLGVGGMAAVYASTHRNGARSAIKIMHTELATDRDIRTRFLREAYIANKVDHPGAVRVLDDDLDEFNTPYIVMELLEGETLESLANRAGGTLPLDVVLEHTARLLDVLSAAHKAGIVHRDIKPENIFVTLDDTLKILDFGIARLKDPSVPSQTRTGFVFGTPAFMTPEQALGRHKQVDHRTDLFAVGAIIFNLVSGETIHDGSTPNEIVISAATRPPRSLSRVMPEAPVALVKIVDKALQFEQTKRFSSADEMREAIVALWQQESMESPKLATSEEPPLPSPSRVTSDDGSSDAVAIPSPSSEPGIELETDLIPHAVSAEGEPGDSGEQRELLSSPILESRKAEATSDEVEILREFFKILDRTLTSQQQYDQDHPEVKRRLEMLEQHLITALETCPDGLLWNVRPYAFSVGEHMLWEPDTPFDRIPYQLFADGVRTIVLLQGLQPSEFYRFLDILTLDRAQDMPPEDDFVTLLWEADFDHIDFEAIDSFAEGDQEQRGSYERSRNKIVDAVNLDTSYLVEDSWRKVKRSGKGARKIDESRQKIIEHLVVTPGPEMEAALRALDFGEHSSPRDHEALQRLTVIDDATYVMLGARLEVTPSTLAERFATTAAEAFVAFVRQGNERAVGNALIRAVDGLAESNAMAAVAMVHTLCEAVVVLDDPEETDRFRTLLAGNIVSEALMKGIWKHVADEATDEEQRERYVDGLSTILKYIDETHLPIIVKAFGEIEQGPIFDVLLKYIGRVANGQESVLGEALPTMDIAQAMKLIHILAELSTPASQEAISQATRHTDPVVRIEALGHIEGVSSERLRTELRLLLQDKDPGVRLVALKAMEDHAVMAAGPFLALRVRSSTFEKLPIAEKQQAFSTLAALAPGRTESICLEVLEDTRLVSSAVHEETRAIAAEVLGRIGSSQRVVEVVDELAKRRWKNTERVRQASRDALARLEARGLVPAQHTHEDRS